jgi:hypothetical protein
MYSTEGKNLGEVAEALGCSIYDLSPWLYMDDPQMKELMRRTVDKAIDDVIKESQGERGN